jgi:hypothetical protein
MMFLSIIYISLLIVVGISAIALVAIYRIDKNSE